MILTKTNKRFTSELKRVKLGTLANSTGSTWPTWSPLGPLGLPYFHRHDPLGPLEFNRT